MAGVKYKFEFDAFVFGSVEKPWQTFNSATVLGPNCVSVLPSTASIITMEMYDDVEANVI
jgi:hypothetical protein